MARTDLFLRKIMARTTRPLTLSALAALTACATTAPAPPAAPPAASPAAAAPAAARTIGDLPAMQRCMDDLLVEHGVAGLTLAVDQITDVAPATGAGTRSLLVQSLSEMTQRSRAIRIVAPDAARDAGGTQFALRGTLRSAEHTLGLDLTLLTTRDMSVVPGMASHNAVTIGAGRAEARKFGAQVSVASPGGRQPALRALVDLAAIELIGRLARVPYWTCFGARATDPEVAAEVKDWYDTLAARPAEIIAYFQRQLQRRQAYAGPIDGAVNPALKDAVGSYRARLGLSHEPKLTLEFFQAYLDADHRALAVQAAEATAAAAAPPAAAAAAPAPTTASAAASAQTAPVSPGASPFVLHVAAARAVQGFAGGERVELTVRPSRDAHVYCFHQDENRKVTRFFPNRFRSDSRVPAADGLQLPGAMRFEIVMNPRRVPEAVACFATENDVLARLPARLGSADFAALPVGSIDELRVAFVSSSPGAVAQQTLQLRPK